MKSFSIISAAIALVAAGTAAQAAAFNDTPTAVRVSYADLDIASPAGRASFDRRIKQAARQACGDATRERDLQLQSDKRQCFRAAVEKAETDLANVTSTVLASR